MSSKNKRILIAACLGVLAFSLMFFNKDILNPIKSLLESPIPPYVIWSYVIVAVVMHKAIIKKHIFTKSDVHESFNIYADGVFTIATLGLAGSTSLALIKGLYTQYFFQEKYFEGFTQFDLVSMMVLSSFLFIYSILNSTKILREAISHTSTVDIEKSTKESR